jgi:hypothetical protein
MTNKTILSELKKLELSEDIDKALVDIRNILKNVFREEGLKPRIDAGHPQVVWGYQGDTCTQLAEIDLEGLEHGMIIDLLNSLSTDLHLITFQWKWSKEEKVKEFLEEASSVIKKFTGEKKEEHHYIVPDQKLTIYFGWQGCVWSCYTFNMDGEIIQGDEIR